MALQSDGFVDIDHSTLVSVLSRETLNCREIVLFDAALAWAEAECIRQDIPPTPAHKRKVRRCFLVLKFFRFCHTHKWVRFWSTQPRDVVCWPNFCGKKDLYNWLTGNLYKLSFLYGALNLVIHRLLSKGWEGIFNMRELKKVYMYEFLIFRELDWRREKVIEWSVFASFFISFEDWFLIKLFSKGSRWFFELDSYTLHGSGRVRQRASAIRHPQPPRDHWSLSPLYCQQKAIRKLSCKATTWTQEADLPQVLEICYISLSLFISPSFRRSI